MPASLFGAGKKELQSDTNSEQRSFGINQLANHISHTYCLKIIHGITCRANAGQYNGCGVEHFRGFIGNLGFIAKFNNSISHAAQVAGAVINALWSVTHDVDKAGKTNYHERFKRYVTMCQEKDLAVSGNITDAKGDRSLPPHRRLVLRGRVLWMRIPASSD